MAITSLYKDYFQKSRVFLYPALDIKRGVSVTPIETYVSWKGHYEAQDGKFICLYHLRDDEDFKLFEKTKLLNHKLFHEFKHVGTNKGLYIFNYDHLKKDWHNFLVGRYSKISESHKKQIQKYMGLKSPHLPYIESFLYPEKYYKMYAEMMGVKENLLREVGELCSIPDLERETLEISIKDLHFTEKLM